MSKSNLPTWLEASEQSDEFKSINVRVTKALKDEFDAVGKECLQAFNHSPNITKIVKEAMEESIKTMRAALAQNKAGKPE